MLASDGVTGDDFGSAVALSGDGETALIGAPGFIGDCADLVFPNCGAAYVLVRRGLD
ncbi:MAG: FG-GAP repeat protein [Gammaproteobacteria bacterium]